MVFWDTLKKFLSGKGINISIVVDKRKQIFIKNDSIVCGDQIVKDQRIVSEVHKLIEKEQDKDSLPFQLVHEDIVDDYFKYEEISIREKESLKKLKKALSTERVECILMARRALLADEKKDSKSRDDLIKQLEKNYPREGKKVYNLMSAGYFDEFIIPFIEVFKEKYQENWFKEYQSFYDGLLKFFPLAIFVGNHTSEGNLQKELEKRLKLDIALIRIHAMGKSNIQKVEEVTKEIEKSSSYSIEDKRFKTKQGLKAQIYEIKR